MRRIVLSLVAFSSAAMLAACSQGGSAFSNNGSYATGVVVTASGNGQSLGIAKVVPGAQINLSAQACTVTPNCAVAPNGTYRWTVVPVASGTYANGGGTTSLCPALPAGTGVAAPITTFYLNNSAGNNITITAPPASQALVGGASPAAPYCMTATATYTPSNAQGSITILVSPGPTP